MLTAAQRTVIFGGSSSWTPQQLPGLIAWYKADNDSTNIFSDTACTVPVTTNGAAVVGWKDRSGNGYNLVNGTGLHRPNYTLAGLNGKPTVTFVAASAQVLETAVGVAMGTGMAGSGFAIGTMTTNTVSNARMVAYAPPSAADNASGGFLYIDRNSTNNSISSNKGGQGPAASAVSLSTETRFGVIANGSTIANYINGVAGSGAPGAGSNAFISGGYLAVGSAIASGGGTGSNLWDGNISEIVITNQAMTPSDFAKLDAYLVRRW